MPLSFDTMPLSFDTMPLLFDAMPLSFDAMALSPDAFKNALVFTLMLYLVVKSTTNHQQPK
jgi:hypothetical protein